MPDPRPPVDAELRLDLLPDLPQARTIRALAPRLWRDERVLAERYGFAYPEELEAVTRRDWRAFQAVIGRSMPSDA